MDIILMTKPTIGSLELTAFTIKALEQASIQVPHKLIFRFEVIFFKIKKNAATPMDAKKEFISSIILMKLKGSAGLILNKMRIRRLHNITFTG